MIADRAWKLNRPTFGFANLVQPLGDIRLLKINEWLANGEVLFDDDFIELYNPQPLFRLYYTNQISPFTFCPVEGLVSDRYKLFL